MLPILSAITKAAVAFAATNIDDIFVLTLFFAQVNNRLKRWHVIAGQYAGFTALVALSLVGYFARFVAPEEWIGLLGLLPIIIGIKKLWQLRGGKREEAHVERPAAHTV